MCEPVDLALHLTSILETPCVLCRNRYALQGAVVWVKWGQVYHLLSYTLQSGEHIFLVQTHIWDHEKIRTGKMKTCDQEHTVVTWETQCIDQIGAALCQVRSSSGPTVGFCLFFLIQLENLCLPCWEKCTGLLSDILCFCFLVVALILYFGMRFVLPLVATFLRSSEWIRLVLRPGCFTFLGL